MFVDPNALIEIKIYYKRSGHHYTVNNEEDYNILSEEEKPKFKCLTVKVRELTWGLYNELNEESVSKDITGNRELNYRRFKENKIRKILVSWDASITNDRGDTIPMPINQDSISKLSPDIAECILSSYDAKMFISESDEKK